MLKFCTERTIDSNISGISDHNFTIVNLQRLHRYLSDATNHLTSYYNPQLFCWIACTLIDSLTFVFANLSYQKNQYSVLLVCSRCMMVLYLSFQVIAISRICHLTCDQVLVYYILINEIGIIFLLLYKIVLGERVGGYSILSRSFCI